jgi:hypothetical protein
MHSLPISTAAAIWINRIHTHHPEPLGNQRPNTGRLLKTGAVLYRALNHGKIEYFVSGYAADGRDTLDSLPPSLRAKAGNQPLFSPKGH